MRKGVRSPNGLYVQTIIFYTMLYYNMNKNAVIGFYSGYNSLDTDKGGLRVFVNSFRKYNNKDLIIVSLVLPIVCKELKEFCENNNCIIEILDLNDVKTGNRLKCYMDVFKTDMYHGYKITNILIMDMNDAMFQSDPFDINTQDKLYLACEKTTYEFFPSDSKFSQNNFNSMQINTTWANQCKHNYEFIINPSIDPSKLIEGNKLNINEERFFKKHIICSGTILGSYDNIHNLLKWSYDKEGADQGLLNIYAYIISPETCLSIPLDESDILTMDSLIFKSLKRDNKLFILNDNNKKYSICHQIDRGGHLQDFLKLCE